MIVKYVPEYGTNGKETTTIEHLLIHTAGIPVAPGSFKEWGDRKRRLERFAQWRPDHPPGEKFVYHVHANYWPIAEAIERISGKRLGEFVRERIAEPLGLPDLRIGLPRALQARMADVKWVGRAGQGRGIQEARSNAAARQHGLDQRRRRARDERSRSARRRFSGGRPDDDGRAISRSSIRRCSTTGARTTARASGNPRCCARRGVSAAAT